MIPREAADRLRQRAWAIGLLSVVGWPGWAGAPKEAAGVLLTNRALASDHRSGKVYAVDTLDGAVSILDPQGSVRARVRVGQDPAAVAVDAQRGRVYVANAGDGTVSILDGKTDRVVATVKAGPHPYVLAANEKTGRVYVTNTFSDLVAVIEADTNAVRFLKIGSADNVIVDARRNRVFLLGYEDPNLRVLDGEAETVTRVAVGEHMWGMAVDEGTGTAFVTRIGAAEVAAIDEETGGVTRMAVGAMPSAVAVDRKTHRVWATNWVDGSVTAMDGVAKRVTGTVQVGRHPQAIAVDEELGRVYVANIHGDTVTVLDEAHGAVLRTEPAGSHPFAVVAASTGSGKVFAAHVGAGAVQVLER